jgi:ribulose-phosphate 3-epimerase
MSKILPAIIPETVKDLRAKVVSVAREVDMVHIDMCDGKYVPSVSWPFAHDWNDFGQFETEEEGLPNWERVDYEIDLMVSNPKYAMERWIKAGASSFVIHAENLKESFDDLLQLAHDGLGLAGIAFLPTTDISKEEKYKEWILKSDFVQCMGISKIGYQAQDFDERVFDQIENILAIKPDAIIAVDGHVDLDNIEDLSRAGVSKFVMGSSIFHEDLESIPQVIAEAKAIIHSASDIL